MLQDYKKYLRRNLTPAERVLWSKLRNKQFFGLKFRRQHVIGGYIVDFYCPAKRLVIEIDGDTHSGNAAASRDEIRTSYLQSLGYQVVRYNNRDVINNLDGVYYDLRARIIEH